MGTSATLSQKKEEILQQDEVLEETQSPVAQSPSASPPSSKSELLNERAHVSYQLMLSYPTQGGKGNYLTLSDHKVSPVLLCSM